MLGQCAGACEELTVLHPPAVREEMVLDAGEGEREARVLNLVDMCLVAQKRGGRRLPRRPGDARGAVDIGVGIGQQLVVALDIAAWTHVLSGGGDIVLPLIGPDHVGPARLVEPVELALAQREDAAQHQGEHPLRMGLGVGESEGGAPRAAEDEPALHPQVLAQRLHVGHQVPGGVRR